MTETIHLALQIMMIGIGATFLMDIWAELLRRTAKIPSLNYSLVGRWLGYMTKGKFCHNSIVQAPALSYERSLGWAAHYITGIFFSALLLWATGEQWLNTPTLIPAITAGVFSLALPFCIMQPALGLGVAAAKTPHPNKARLRSLLAHLVFGYGLYISARGLLLMQS